MHNSYIHTYKLAQPGETRQVPNPGNLKVGADATIMAGGSTGV